MIREEVSLFAGISGMGGVTLLFTHLGGRVEAPPR